MGNSASVAPESGAAAAAHTAPTRAERKPVTTKTTERDASADLQYAVSGMKGWRPTMEDQHLMSSHLVVDGTDEILSDHSLFAIFDGHGGGFTSQYLKDHFLHVLAARPQLKKYAALNQSGSRGRTDCHGVKLLRDALAATFVQLDADLRVIHDQHTQPERRSDSTSFDVFTSALFPDTTTPRSLSPVDRSGSTAVVVIVTPAHIVCANAGDSRAVLRRCGGVTLPLSFDHKPHHVVERRRIYAAGGTVLRHGRIDGDLAVSRAFGDFCMKAQSHLPAHQQKVVVHPDCIVYPRKHAADEYIILACDGVWDVATNEQCAHFVHRCLVHGENDLGRICEAALDQCLEHKSRDNMTLMLVGFHNMPVAKTDASASAATTLHPSRSALRRGSSGKGAASQREGTPTPPDKSFQAALYAF